MVYHWFRDGGVDLGRLITEAEVGVFAIAVTPFDAGGQLLVGDIENLVEFYVAAGVSGLTILGMMGEADKLLPEESLLVAERFLAAVAGRVPVVVGVSSPNPRSMGRLAGLVMDKGASGVMIAPGGNLKHDAAVSDYVRTACEVVGERTPVVLQDFPQATGVQMPVTVLNSLVRDLPQIVMLKHEDVPGLAKLSRIRATVAEAGRRISILTGNGGLFLPQEMGRGADGAMTGFGYPEMLVGVVRLAREGRMDAAEDLFDAYLPLVRYEQQPVMGLAVRKEILFRRGVLSSASLRRPGYVLTREDRTDLDTMMDRLQRRLTSV